MPHRTAGLAVPIMLAGAVLLAQAPSPAPQEPVTTFRSSIEAVQIHAYVTDADGATVTDLTADDFEIVENGVARPVTTFALVDIPIEQPLGRAATWVVEPDVAANQGPEGRLYLFLLDEVRPDLALRTRAFLRRFLEEHFGPHDHAAVSITGRGLARGGTGFTSNPRVLLRAMDRYTGGFEPRACQSRERYYREGGDSMSRNLPIEEWSLVQSRIESLRRAAEILGSMPGGRKVILYFTECLGHDMFEVRDYRGGVLSPLEQDAHAAMAAATRGNVVFYPIDPAGLTMDGAQLDAMTDMTALARVTGGFALSNSNNLSQTFERVVRENSTYYVLGFNSAYDRRDGRYVRVDVRVRRPGVRVQSSEGYVAPLGRRAGGDASTAPASPTGAALASPVVTRGLPLRVSAAPYKGAGNEAAVALVVEIGAWDLPLVEQDGVMQTTVQVSYVATDAGNRSWPGGLHALTVSRPSGRRPPPTEQWLRVVSQLALPPGEYQVRVAAAAGTRSGSVLYDLDVPEFGRAPLELSGIVVSAASTAGMATLRPAAGSGALGATRCRPPSCTVPLAINAAPGAEDPLAGALPSPPTTRRAFERGDTLVLFAEVYERVRRTDEHRLTFTAELRGEDGLRVPVVAETRLSTAERRPSGGHGFTVRLPLAGVPPGRYALHVEAYSGAGRGATASRALPIEVR